MTRSWWFRFSLLVFFLVTAFVHVTPTLGNLNLESTKFPFKKKINLGLDLQGGLYMVYGVDFAKMYKETLERSTESMISELDKEGIGGLRMGATDTKYADDPTLSLSVDAGSKNSFKDLFDKRYKGTLRLLEETKDGFQVSLAREYRQLLKDNTLSQSVQVIRNRIDEFGVTEPSITTKGENRVVVELPGVKEVERAKQLVGRTARLEFRIVNDEAMPQAQVAALVNELQTKNNLQFKEGQKFSEFAERINQLAKDKIPADSVILFERIQGQNIPYLLFTKIELTGNELQDAFVSFDQQNQRPIVSFQLNPRGAQSFGDVTGANVGKRLAIVLDDIVHSAPVIQSKIGGGSGQITLGAGGEEAFKEAKDLAIVLRAGALPARLDLLEQRVIGPSLGQDSIRSGVTAGLVGCALVFIFMVIYYRMSGMVAVVSLVFNGLFTLAILIGMDATLTLPGIAGLALTIGMAVDSNVIIFERIRDELIEGKGVLSAVQSGFDKAFACIFDANITHGIVALILLNFGSGPIKGFAITLLVGIATTLFCAVTVCKLFFDYYLAKNSKLQKLSI